MRLSKSARRFKQRPVSTGAHLRGRTAKRRPAFSLGRAFLDASVEPMADLVIASIRSCRSYASTRRRRSSKMSSQRPEACYHAPQQEDALSFQFVGFDFHRPRVQMRRSASIITLFSVLLGSTIAVRPYTVQLTDGSGNLQVRWLKKTINVALSTSLTSPGANIKPGSDVAGAARRAMSRWSGVANIQFVETVSNAQSISPSAGGDGLSLITIADTPENNAAFAGGGNTGRTRVFYDSATGSITEADVVINPHPVSADGSPVQFSTDGTPGTYDLESAFTHELGHLLGLEHSGVIAATMQARQGVNGLYNLPSATNRTLS